MLKLFYQTDLDCKLTVGVVPGAAGVLLDVSGSGALCINTVLAFCCCCNKSLPMEWFPA